MSSFVVVTLVGISFQVFAQDDVVKQMKADIEYLASDKLEGRQTGTEGEVLAAKYISGRMKKLKLEPKGTDGYYQLFHAKHQYDPHAKIQADTTKEIEGRNVMGYIDNGANTTVVIGGHYDHLGWGDHNSLHDGDSAIHNGADDNASGITVMLELARRLKGRNTNNNYLFIAFSGEEKGLWGSNWFTKNATLDMGSVNYMINMDMVGRMDSARTLAIFGTGTSPSWQPLVEKIAGDSIVLSSKLSGIGASDHTSFYLKDIPALHFFTGQHEDYHKPTDDVEKINYDGMMTVANFIDHLVTELDDDGKLTFTKTKDEGSHKAPQYSVTLGVVPDYMFPGPGMKIDGVKEDKPAQKAGLVAGDILLKMGDVEVGNMRDYMTALGKFKPGDTTTVKVKRGDEELEFEVIF